VRVYVWHRRRCPSRRKTQHGKHDGDDRGDTREAWGSRTFPKCLRRPHPQLPSAPTSSTPLPLRPPHGLVRPHHSLWVNEPRPSFPGARLARPTIIPHSSPIARSDLITSAERIFLRYLPPVGASPGGGESHEIYLPPALRVHSFLLSSATGSAVDRAAIAQVPDVPRSEGILLPHHGARHFPVILALQGIWEFYPNECTTSASRRGSDFLMDWPLN
jgi:hypothetical protein